MAMSPGRPLTPAEFAATVGHLAENKVQEALKTIQTGQRKLIEQRLALALSLGLHDDVYVCQEAMRRADATKPNA